MVNRKNSNMSPAGRKRPGVNLAGLAGAMAIFALLVALGHWVDARTHAAPGAASRKPAASRPADRSVAPAQVLTLVQPVEPDTVSEPEPESEESLDAAAEPVIARDSSPAPDTPARARSVYNNEVYSAPAKPREKTPAPARTADNSFVFKAPSISAARPASRPSAPDSSPVPPAMSAKPPAQNNPAMKPASSKPKSSDTSLPDRVARVAPPKTPGAAEPFYSVRLNKADSKYLADVVADTLKQHGFDESRVVPTSDGKYTVTVGDYNFRYAAENAKKQLNDLGFNETFIDEKTVAE